MSYQTSLIQLPNGDWCAPLTVMSVVAADAATYKSGDFVNSFRPIVMVDLTHNKTIVINCDSFDDAIKKRDQIAASVNLAVEKRNELLENTNLAIKT